MQIPLFFGGGSSKGIVLGVCLSVLLIPHKTSFEFLWLSTLSMFPLRKTGFDVFLFVVERLRDYIILLLSSIVPICTDDCRVICVYDKSTFYPSYYYGLSLKHPKCSKLDIPKAESSGQAMQAQLIATCHLLLGGFAATFGVGRNWKRHDLVFAKCQPKDFSYFYRSRMFAP